MDPQTQPTVPSEEYNWDEAFVSRDGDLILGMAIKELTETHNKEPTGQEILNHLIGQAIGACTYVAPCLMRSFIDKGYSWSSNSQDPEGDIFFNYCSQTLYWACAEGWRDGGDREEFINLIREAVNSKSVDINVRGEPASIIYTGHTDWTLLHVVAMHDEPQVLRALLELGIDRCAVDNMGWTALHVSVGAFEGANNNIRILCADAVARDDEGFIDVLSENGESALALCVKACELKRARLLSSLGANPFECNNITEAPIAQIFAYGDIYLIRETISSYYDTHESRPYIDRSVIGVIIEKSLELNHLDSLNQGLRMFLSCYKARLGDDYPHVQDRLREEISGGVELAKRSGKADFVIMLEGILSDPQLFQSLSHG